MNEKIKISEILKLSEEKIEKREKYSPERVILNLKENIENTDFGDIISKMKEDDQPLLFHALKKSKEGKAEKLITQILIAIATGIEMGLEEEAIKLLAKSIVHLKMGINTEDKEINFIINEVKDKKTNFKKSKISQIIILSEKFCNMLSHKGTSLFNVVNTIMDLSAKELPFEVVKSFVKRIGVYPLTSKVVLSTGQVAEVIRQNPDSPLNPVVEIQQEADGRLLKKKYQIDLSESNIEIKEIL